MYADIYEKNANEIAMLYYSGKTSKEIIKIFVDRGYNKDYITPIVIGVITDIISESIAVC